MSALSPILKFNEVTIESSRSYETGLWNSSFNLHPGELLLVRMEREDERLPLADASEGLVSPAHGSVMFLGEDWQGMSADRAASARGKIGRLFDDEGWISDLDVDENILLGQRHHTRRGEKDIMETYGAPGHIQVNETTYARLRDKYLFEDRGEFYVKDRGELKTYFLKGRNLTPSRLT